MTTLYSKRNLSDGSFSSDGLERRAITTAVVSGGQRWSVVWNVSFLVNRGHNCECDVILREIWDSGVGITVHH